MGSAGFTDAGDLDVFDDHTEKALREFQASRRLVEDEPLSRVNPMQGTLGLRWRDECAADWFDEMFDATGLALHVEEILQRDVREYAEEIRAATFVLLALGRLYVWPGGKLEPHLKLAASRLQEILATGIYPNRQITGAIEAQLTEIRSRLPSGS